MQPGAERLLQLRPGAAQRGAEFADFQLVLKIFGEIGAGFLHEGVLTALAPHTRHRAAGAAATARQQDEQIFQMDDELLHRAEGQLGFDSRALAGCGRGVKQLVGGVRQPAQIVLLGGLCVHHRAAEAIHCRAGAVKIDAQRLRRHLADRGHGEHLARLVEQQPAGPQQDAAVIAAFLNRAAAHEDQLPRLRLAGREGVVGAPFRRARCRHRFDPQRKFFVQHGWIPFPMDVGMVRLPSNRYCVRPHIFRRFGVLTAPLPEHPRLDLRQKRELVQLRAGVG